MAESLLPLKNRKQLAHPRVWPKNRHKRLHRRTVDRLTALEYARPKAPFPGLAARRTDSTLVETRGLFSQSAEESRCPVERRRHVVERPNKSPDVSTCPAAALLSNLVTRTPAAAHRNHQTPVAAGAPWSSISRTLRYRS